MALDFRNDNTILYLLQGNNRKFYKALLTTTAEDPNGLASKKTLADIQKDARSLRDLILASASNFDGQIINIVNQADAGDGNFFYIKYAPTGTPTAAQMTDTPQDDTTHMGVCCVKSEVAPNDPRQYTWSAILGEGIMTLQIVSSNGNIFKNRNIFTNLSAVVWISNEDCTDLFDSNCFQWTRVSNDAEGDVRWNHAHFGGTKSVSITSEDVYGRATFFCTLDSTKGG